MLIKENEFVTSISYTVNSYITNYTAFSIKPLYNISYVITKCDVSYSSFELKNGTSKNITNLKSGNEYYLFIPAEQFHRVNKFYF